LNGIVTQKSDRATLKGLGHAILGNFSTDQIVIEFTYSHSRKTVNNIENFWNAYCFATNQKRDETAEDNRQTAASISHDLIRNNEQGFSFSNTEIVLFAFQFIYVQRLDMNDIFSDIFTRKRF